MKIGKRSTAGASAKMGRVYRVAALIACALVWGRVGFAASLFGTPSSYQVDGSPAKVLAIQLDGQPGLDLVTGNQAGEEGPSLSLLLNRGEGSFFPEVRTTLNGSQYILHTIAAGDFNGDGIGDIAAAVDDITVFPAQTTVLVLLNDGMGQFADPQPYTLNGLFPQCLKSADIDGDGVQDLVVCHSTVNGGQGLISVLLGQSTGGRPNGTFSSGMNFPVGTSPASVAVADVDGDGHTDLVVADPGQGAVFVLYGTGTAGLFGAPVTLSVVESPSAVLVAHVGGQALPDILVTSFSTSQLLIFPQNAPRVFGAPTSTFVSPLPTAMGMADFDGDGIADLVIASLQSGQISLFHGSADGTFTLSGTAAAGSSPESLAIADLNGDGKPDVAVSSLTTDQVTVLLNGADAPLTPTPSPTESATGSAARTPTATMTPTRTSGQIFSPTPSPTPTSTPVPGTPTPTTTPAGPGDADCDGRIDSGDIDALISRMFRPGCPAADVNGDGQVTAADLPALLGLLTTR